jgi:murein DD-endopeptidase MepM/ murein hydrolase activator NlpD
MGEYGKLVEISHGNGVTTRYGHLSDIKVREGQKVARGAVIGNQGNTGRSTGTHLHYEVRIHDKPQNPISFLRAGGHVQ